MSLSKKLLPLQDRLLALADPNHFDVTPAKLLVRTRVWNGAEIGSDGGYVDTDFTLPQRYEVEHVDEKLSTASGGRYEIGDQIIRVCPAYFDDLGVQLGGATPAQLKPAGDEKTEIIYVLDGENHKGEYALKALHTEDVMEYVVVLARTRATP